MCPAMLAVPRPKFGAVAVRIQFIERTGRKRLLSGWRAGYIGIKKARGNNAATNCVEAADHGFGIGRGGDAGEVKDVASDDREIGKGRYILPLKRATSS